MIYPYFPTQEKEIRYCINLQVVAMFAPRRIKLTKHWSPFNPADLHLFTLLERSKPGACVADFYDDEALMIIKRRGL